MKARSGRRKSENIKERISLNPKLEEDDRKACESVLQDHALKDQLEHVWFAVLKSGDCLKKERCDTRHFKVFALESKYGNTERNIAAAFRCFDVQVDDQEMIDFHGFIKCVFHMGMERFNTDEYAVAMTKVMEQFLWPWYQQFKTSQENDGTGADERLLDLPEIDRLLYIYDGVFERLFNRYKDRADHANRDLSLDQLKVLDSLVEMDEVRYFMQDFGFFPKFISFVEISKCSQFACFGKLVVDPTKQGASRQSHLEASKSIAISAGVAEDMSGQAAALNAAAAEGSTAEFMSVNKVSNPLFIASLPPEFQCDEVLLDKARYMTCFMRLAQALFGRPEFTKKFPSIPSRVEEMLNQCAPTYDKMFGRTMDQDCDFTEKGVPILQNDSSSSACHPLTGPMAGAFEVSIGGGNFCEKRGVFVRFGEGDDAIVVRSKQIHKKKVVVNAPAMKPRDTVVHVKFHHTYKIEMIKETSVAVECSNNRWVYSSTDPPQILTFQMELPSLDLEEKISAKLLKFFSSVCAVNDRYNTKFLYRDKWKTIKQLCQIVEISPQEDVNDPYFLERAEYPEGAKDMCLNFKSYLRVVCRALFQIHQEKWSEELIKLADVTLQQPIKQVILAPKLEEDDITSARRTLELVDRRRTVELDLFLGPVLCGTLSNRAGDVTSCCSGGKPTVHRKGHPFLCYEQREINSETSVLAHIRVAQSFPHLLNRLLNGGFDFSCKHYTPGSCKPAGRCWEIMAMNEEKTRLGALWDYPGNFCNMDWQPAYQDMKHKNITMTFYVEESSVEYVHAFLAYSKAKDIAHIRTLLQAKNFDLRTKLYKLP